MRRALPWLIVALLVILVPLWLSGPLARQRGNETLRRARQLQLANRPREALALYGDYLNRTPLAGEMPQRVAALLGSAQAICTTAGDLDEAAAQLRQALELARRQGSPSLEADALSGLGLFYWYYRRQRHRPLDEHYRPALQLYRLAQDRRGMAVVHSRTALVYLAEGDYGAVAEHLEASRQLFAALGDKVGLSDVYRYLGVLQGQLERYDLARQHFEHSRRLSQDGGYALGADRVDEQLAHLHLRLGEPVHSLEILDRLIASPGGSDYARRNRWTTRGHALLHLGRPDAAGASYQQALDLDRRASGSDVPFRATTLAMLAHAHMQRSDLDAAAATLTEAEAIPIHLKGWGPTVIHTLARADLADAQGTPTEAMRYLLTAAEIEHQTFGSARSLFFQSQYRQVFDRLFSLLFAGTVEQDAAEELAFRFVEQLRYRSYRSLMVRLGEVHPEPSIPGALALGERVGTPQEALALSRIEALQERWVIAPQDGLWQELRLAYGDYEDSVLRAELTASRYRRAVAERPVEWVAVQRALAPRQALVEYVLAGSRWFALIITDDGMDSVVIPLSASALEAKVKLWRRLLLDASGGEVPWRPLADELGRAVLQPILGHGSLDGIDDLVLVPMDILHDLPFAALGLADGRLLVERFSLQRTPSATLWARRRLARSAAPSPGVATDLAFGLRRAIGSSLPALEQAEVEAQAMAATFGGRARVAEDATEAAFKGSAPGSRRLHLATHGVVVSRVPLHSYLQLQPGDGEDGRMTVREILELDLRAELVTLSACATGSSPVALRSAQLEVDRLGFVEAFLHAGAGQVLAPLLPVDDAASSFFMARFYHHLQSMDSVQALAASQRELLRGTSPSITDTTDWRHPRYWAPFVLVTGASGGRVGGTRGDPRSASEQLADGLQGLEVIAEDLDRDQ